MTDPHDGWTPEVQAEIQPGDPTHDKRAERPEWCDRDDCDHDPCLTGLTDPIKTDKAGLDDLVVAYATARDNRERVSDEEKALRAIEARAELALFDRMEALSLRSVRHGTLGLFSLNDMANAVVTDEAALREWALEVMPELMLPNRQRLGKIVRDTLKEGGDLPPGTDFATYRKINWRRAVAT
jgi:hypothetical protein